MHLEYKVRSRRLHVSDNNDEALQSYEPRLIRYALQLDSKISAFAGKSINV